MIKLFITGTGTSVGKTFFSALLCEYYLKKNLTVNYIKPVQTGWPESDENFIKHFVKNHKNFNSETLYYHEKPVAPCLVFKPFPFENAVRRINKVTNSDVLIVESAGGITVPLDEKRFNYEFIKECNLSVVLVVPNRLGCVNDTILNTYFIRKNSFNFKGIALNNFFSETKFDIFNKQMILKYTDSTLFCEFDSNIIRIME